MTLIHIKNVVTHLCIGPMKYQVWSKYQMIAHVLSIKKKISIILYEMPYIPSYVKLVSIMNKLLIFIQSNCSKLMFLYQKRQHIHIYSPQVLKYNQCAFNKYIKLG